MDRKSKKLAIEQSNHSQKTEPQVAGVLDNVIIKETILPVISETLNTMTIVLRPQGKLDVVGAATLQQKIEKVATLASSGQKTWIIDMDQVSFINHFGLTALVTARRYAQRQGCRLILRNLRSSVQTLLDVAQLSDQFEILHQEAEFEEKTKLQSSNTEVSLEVTTEDGITPLNEQSLNTIHNLQRILGNFKSQND